MTSVCDTSTTWIQRLGENDPRAWEDFASKYTWMMRCWLRSLSIPSAEVEDVVQDVCLRVFKNIHKFQHHGQGSFRAWLKKVSRSCWFQILRKSAYQARSEYIELDLATLMSEEMLCQIDSQIDMLIEQEQFEFALARTRQYFSESTWISYRMTAIEGHSGAFTSQSLGISVDAVYKNKERFEVGLNHELRILNETE